MTTTTFNSAQEIKTAIDNGVDVRWSNDGYTVYKDNIGQYLITYDRGGYHEHCIGLTWRDGVTLNGELADFYVAAERSEMDGFR